MVGRNMVIRYGWITLGLVLALVGIAMSVLPTEAPPTSREAYAKREQIPLQRELDLGGSVRVQLLLVPPGRFMMGDREPSRPAPRWVGLMVSLMCGAVGGTLVWSAWRRSRLLQRAFQFSLRTLFYAFALASVMVGGLVWNAELAGEWARYYRRMAQYDGRSGTFAARPSHWVTITRALYVGKFEVTQEQFERIMGYNPSAEKGGANPVEMVSWEDACEFCRRLSTRTGSSVRLPTEAEWELACSSGKGLDYNWLEDEEAVDGIAWTPVNSCADRYAEWGSEEARGRTHPVGTKKPNDFGLYDMLGNASEWCADWYAAYAEEEAVDPLGHAAEETEIRVLRGGSVRRGLSGNRSLGKPTDRNADTGFRIVMDR